LAGIGVSGGKTSVKAALLAEEIRLDPIGQGIESLGICFSAFFRCRIKNDEEYPHQSYRKSYE